MGLIEIINSIDRLTKQRMKEAEAHKKVLAAIDSELASLREARQVVSHDLDLNKVKLAETAIRIRGEYTGSRQRASVVQSAISDIAKGCPHLKTEYYGVKIYSGFGEQLEHHQYGYGPRHGSIVFAVELAACKRDLTEEESEAAIYYLLNIAKIADAKKSAAA